MSKKAKPSAEPHGSAAPSHKGSNAGASGASTISRGTRAKSGNTRRKKNLCPPSSLSPRHEAFAQALAKGEVADKAYQTAGFKKNDGNCIRLKGNERIKARVAELQQAGATEAVLTIQEKREFLARLMRAKPKELAEDSDLWQEIRTTMDGVILKMPDKLRAIQVDNDLSGEGSEAKREVTVVVRIGGSDDAND